jgi:glycosyltransferase involved in cell wall biosynthesis
MGKPLVTFALSSYNQERYVREAVRGALAQTYSPLQIVISDDCSQDGTFEAIREEVAGYDGPHRVVLNRNGRNLGIGGNVNRAMELAQGELIVQAAGDDVSLPTRTEELAKVWSSGGVSCVYSDVAVIDESGADRGPFYKYAPTAVESWQDVVQREHGVVLGCSSAWDRAVFDTFGPMPDHASLGDYTIEFRSALLNKIACVDKRLVKYRRHAETITGHHVHELGLPQLISRQVKWARAFAAEYEGWLRDIETCIAIHPELQAELLQAAETIAARVAFHKFKVSSVESSRVDRLRSCSHAIKSARKLGLLPLVKIGFLGVSPRTYYRITKLGLRLTKGRPLERGVEDLLTKAKTLLFKDADFRKLIGS